MILCEKKVIELIMDLPVPIPEMGPRLALITIGTIVGTVVSVLILAPVSGWGLSHCADYFDSIAPSLVPWLSE